MEAATRPSWAPLARPGRNFFLSVRGGIVPLSNAWVTRPKAIKAKVVFPPAGVSDKEGWRLG